MSAGAAATDAAPSQADEGTAGSPAVLELAGVTKSYPGQPPVRALAGVDLVVRQGEFVAITGRSGSGKSTLLHVMGILDRPDSGTVRVTGQDIARLTDRQLAALRATRIGFVFQQFFLAEHSTAAAGPTAAQHPGCLGREPSSLGGLLLREPCPEPPFFASGPGEVTAARPRSRRASDADRLIQLRNLPHKVPELLIGGHLPPRLLQLRSRLQVHRPRPAIHLPRQVPLRPVSD